MGSPTEQIGPMQKALFKIAMRGEWGRVVEKHRENPILHTAKITRSSDTALHIAVSDLQEDIVQELIDLIRNFCKGNENRLVEALSIQNDKGNTPLHIAASMGSVKMCECIASVHPKLIGARNLDRETPFFLAALHGKKQTFLCLHSKCGTGPGGEKKGYSYCRRNDGDTILHCAIAGDYFDLAYQIIYHYENLVNSVNEEGLSPLHLLATKHSAFKSGSRLSGWFNKFIYYCCIFVDELKPESTNAPPSLLKSFKEEKNPNYPENYRTCMNFYRLLGGLTKVVFGRARRVTNKICAQAELKKPQIHSQVSVKNDVHKIDVENPYSEARYKGIKSKLMTCQSTNELQPRQLFPENYGTCINFTKLLSKAMLIILGLGSTGIKKLQEKKEKHTWSVQIMNELVQRASTYEYEDNGRSPPQQPTQNNDGETLPYAIVEGGNLTIPNTQDFIDDKQQAIPPCILSKTSPREDQNKKKDGQDSHEEGVTKNLNRAKKETPILIAAKNGITEIIENILEYFPVAIHDLNSEKKNVVLLAVENRQPHVYQMLLNRNILKDSVFSKVDIKGNSALHLAAVLGEHRPWLIPGAALQMQWEIKWYEFVKQSMPLHFFARYNKDGKTAKDVFTENHEGFVKSGGEWLTNTSESCSVVAALIATVAFATSATVPGGVNQDSGAPTLEDKPPFNIFAISSLVALCFSVTAVVMFLAILTSRYQERDFGKSLPRKLLLGLTSLFVSIASMLISFCAGHFFVLKDELKYAAFPVYAVTCLPVTFFAIAQFPLYFDLMWATFKKIPQRSYKVIYP